MRQRYLSQLTVHEWDPPASKIRKVSARLPASSQVDVTYTESNVRPGAAARGLMIVFRTFGESAVDLQKGESRIYRFYPILAMNDESQTHGDINAGVHFVMAPKLGPATTSNREAEGARLTSLEEG